MHLVLIACFFWAAPATPPASASAGAQVRPAAWASRCPKCPRGHICVKDGTRVVCKAIEDSREPDDAPEDLGAPDESDPLKIKVK